MRSRTSAAVGLVLLVGCGGGGGGGGTVSNPTSNATPAPVPTPVPTPTPPPALNVTGGWRSEARSWNFNLTQSGTSLTGVVTGFKNVTYPNLSDPVLQISGTVGPGSAVSFRAPIAAIDFTGVAEPSGLRMTGTLFDCVTVCRSYGEILDKR